MPSSSHVINDPIHMAMGFSDREKDLIRSIIDAPVFQRLRQIRQLGLKDAVFPGATHTRFAHSIGAAYIGKLISARLDVGEAAQLDAIRALLLHDVGHGPFSHAFEKVLRVDNSEKKEEKVDHEDWTEYFLTELSGSNALSPAEAEQARLLIVNDPKRNFLLGDIVSSQLDADRLDYLLRDSHFCGVSYGTYDLKWLIECAVRVETQAGERLGVSVKGVGVLEHFLHARRLMTLNVYYHPKARAAETNLVRFLVELIKEIEGPSRTTPVSKFLSNDVTEFFGLAAKFRNKSLSKKEFLSRAYPHYRSMSDDSIRVAAQRIIAESGSPEESRLFVTARNLLQRTLPKVFRVIPGRVELVRNLLGGFITGDDPMCEIDEPPFSTYKSAKSPLLVVDSKSQPLSAAAVSPFIKLIEDRIEPTAYVFAYGRQDEVEKLLRNSQVCL